MIIIKWDENERQSIAKYGETCFAVAEKAMQRSGLNFDDIESINNHHEDHRWGSNTDRKYRQAAINKAIHKVAANPTLYI